jgi:hypothetical protein
MSDQRRLYSVATSASCQIDAEVVTQTASLTIYAEDEDRAINRARYDIFERCPTAHGWTNHQVALTRIPDELVKAAYEALVSSN